MTNSDCTNETADDYNTINEKLGDSWGYESITLNSRSKIKLCESMAELEITGFTLSVGSLREKKITKEDSRSGFDGNR